MPFNDCECALIVEVDSPQEPDEQLASLWDDAENSRNASFQMYY